MAKRNKIATMAVRELDARIRKQARANKQKRNVVNVSAIEPEMVERTNLMTGKKFMERADTPLCCSPASETYWCM